VFGKSFASMYTGSMLGAGMHVFAVWGYVLANTDRKGFVELNPKLVAVQLGGAEQEVQAALDYLAAPDSTSRSPAEEGRRLVNEGPFLFRVVNYLEYRQIRDAEERREYLRVKKQESRARARAAGVDRQQPSTLSTHAEGEGEGDAEAKTTTALSTVRPKETGNWVSEAIKDAGVEDFTAERLLWEARTVFAFWHYRAGKNGKVVILTDDRRARIQRWLKIYGLEDCLLAVEGTFHHPDHNQEGRTYHELENIFKARGSGTIEKLRDAGQRHHRQVKAIIDKLTAKGWRPSE
jgi:hypothetical protein